MYVWYVIYVSQGKHKQTKEKRMKNLTHKTTKGQIIKIDTLVNYKGNISSPAGTFKVTTICMEPHGIAIYISEIGLALGCEARTLGLVARDFEDYCGGRFPASYSVQECATSQKA